MEPILNSPLRNNNNTLDTTEYGSIRRKSTSGSIKTHSTKIKEMINNQNQSFSTTMDTVLEYGESVNSKNSQKVNITHKVWKTKDPNNLSTYQLFQYYLPCLAWLPNYTILDFFSDLIAGISLASFQIPLALSYATSIAHVKPLCGLYSLAITPFIYGILGSVPQMIVGPESAISLVVGQAIEQLHGKDSDTEHPTDRIAKINISVVITFFSGVILLVCGLMRLGFLGSILSKPLLRSFISSVGCVMVIDSLLAELKLNKLLQDKQEHYHTAFKKIIFIIKYGPSNFHKPTAILSLCSFSFLFAVRHLKKKVIVRHRWLIFLPEILFVVILTSIFSSKYNFKGKYGIDVIGDINEQNLNSISENIHNPLSKQNRMIFPLLTNTGFIIATLGFFESTTASKSLGTTYDLSISSNRELVALGAMNLVASIFGALPSFGGYGRSKINAFSGARSVMSGVCMGAITLLTIRLLLGFIHFIPSCILSVITTIVGLSLLEEAPSEIKFHWRCRGYNELIIIFITALSTFLYSVEIGIVIGCGYSIITIIKNSAQSRIQILGRLPGTRNFVNIDDYFEDIDYKNTSNNFSNPGSSGVRNIEDPNNSILEEIEGCLIVKVPEPLTFSNTEDLKERLNRLERFGSTRVHPASSIIRSQDLTKYVIFDLHGVTFLDSSASQLLLEIIEQYNRRNVDVLLCRVPNNKLVRDLLERSNVKQLVMKTNLMNSPNSGNNIDSYYFTTVEDALCVIETKESHVSSVEDVIEAESFMSSTYINSNIV